MFQFQRTSTSSLLLVAFAGLLAPAVMAQTPPIPTVWIDSPVAGSTVVGGLVTVSGWAINNIYQAGDPNNDKITNVAVQAGTFSIGAGYGPALNAAGYHDSAFRPDVCNIWQNRPDCPYVGFLSLFPIGSQPGALATGLYDFIVTASAAGQPGTATASSVYVEPAEAPPPMTVNTSSDIGYTQTFSFTATSTNAPHGDTDVGTMLVLFNSTAPNVDGTHACYIRYSPADNAIWLANDNGDGWLTAGIVHDSLSAPISNSQCTIDVAASNVSHVPGSPTLTLNVVIAFQHGFYGRTLNLWTHTAQQVSGWGAGWGLQPGWSWAVPPETISPPAAPSGITNGAQGIGYGYTAGGALSILGHALQYQFNWGDGTSSDWLTPDATGAVVAGRGWLMGVYNVSVRARCAVDQSAVSAYSEPLVVTIGDFSLTISPELQIVKPGDTGEFVIKMNALNGYNHQVRTYLYNQTCAVDQFVQPGMLAPGGQTTLQVRLRDNWCTTSYLTIRADDYLGGVRSATVILKQDPSAVVITKAPTTPVLAGQQVSLQASAGFDHVTWTLSPALGTIVMPNPNYTSFATYTAPNPMPPGAGPVLITATNDAWHTQGSTTITFGSAGGVSVAVYPTSAIVGPKQTRQISAAVSGTSNPAVTWTLSGPGTLTQEGAYTAPASFTPGAIVTITAKSVVDEHATASATIALMAELANSPVYPFGDSEINIDDDTGLINVSGWTAALSDTGSADSCVSMCLTTTGECLVDYCATDMKVEQSFQSSRYNQNSSYVENSNHCGAARDQETGSRGPYICEGRTHEATSGLLSPILQLTSNGTQVPPNGIIYIDTAPAMPELTARLVSSNGQPMSSGSVTWRLLVEFDQILKSYGPQHHLAAFPTGPVQQFPATQSYQFLTPATTPVIGGDARVEWTYNDVTGTPFRFSIRGRNPDDTAAFAELSNASNFWFTKNMAIEESNASNFCQPGRTDGDSYCRDSTNVGMPVMGPPAGYGIMQVDPSTSDPQLSFDDIWNWRQNIAAGQRELRLKAGEVKDTSDAAGNGTDARAYPFWLRQVKQWKLWNQAHPNPAKPQPAQQQEGSNCLFKFAELPITGQSGTYWFGDAILIKQYNGAPTNYVSWDNESDPANPVWSFNKENPVNYNYVGDVCSCSSVATCQHHPK